MKKIIGIACVDRNGYYAKQGGGPLPWPHTEGDLDFFKYITNGGILVVGNNSYQELLKLPPLKNREIWPVGKGHELKNIDDVLNKYQDDDTGRTLFVGGGNGLWSEFYRKGYFDNFYLTILKKSWVEKDDSNPYEGMLSYGLFGAIKSGKAFIEKPNYKVYVG